MHELSIAQSIVALAEEQAQNHKASVIEELELEIGCLAGVERKSLDFALKSAIKGSLLEHARIVRHYIPGEGRCGECDAIFPMSGIIWQCPLCGSWLVNIIRGRELRVKSLTVK